MFVFIYLQSWTKVLGHFCVSGAISNAHRFNLPPLTPQTMLDACIQNFFRVSTLYRVGGGRTARKFRKGCTVLRGNREMTEKYEYCSTVARTFVQDCSFMKSNTVYVASLCTFVRFEEISPSIRFDISLQNFKKPSDIFSHRK